jgi:S1-C subfamily serine protease
MQRLLSVTLLTLGASCVVAPPSSEKMLVTRHAVQVENPMGFGSGFPITEDSWLTAWHVVEGWAAEDITVDGWIVLEVIRLEGLDAAVLVTGLHGQEPWPLADRAPRPGERVFKSGYGQGFHWWTEGIATEDADRVAIDIFPGDSGGPLFNERGEVLGIVVAVGVTQGRFGAHDHILHHAWIVPMVLILPLLDLNGAEPELEMPAGPLPVEETPWERFLRLKKERGL